MRKKWRIILLSSLVLILGVFAWLVFQNNEPAYQGKSLTVWLEQYKENSGIDPEAEAAIRAIGDRALPTLLSLLGTRDTALRRNISEFAAGHKWFPIHLSPLEEVHEKCAYGFMALGPLGKAAVADLIRYLGNTDAGIRACAASSLASIGLEAKDAVPALLNCLTAAVRSNVLGTGIGDKEAELAAYALGEIGPAATPAVPDLVSISTNQALANRGYLRIEARAALIKIRPAYWEPLLQTLMDTSDTTNWLQADSVLMMVHNGGDPAVPALVRCLSQTNSLLHNAALVRLGKIHARPDICIPAILPFLDSTNGWQRSLAIESICDFGPTTNHLGVPEIIKCLSDQDADVAWRARRALKQIDPAAAAKLRIK